MNGYTLNSPAALWYEGSLCGSGSLGAIVMGKAAHEQIILNREELFAPINGREKPIPMAEYLPGIRELTGEGNYLEAGAIPWKLFLESYPEKLWTNPFIPAGDLTIETKNAGIYTDYCRSLDFETGIAECSFQAGGIVYTRKVLASRLHQQIFLELSADYVAEEGNEAKAEYELALEKHPYEEEELFGTSREELSAFLLPEVHVSDDAIKYLCRYGNGQEGYTIHLQILKGQGRAEGSHISIKGSGSVFIVLTIVLPGEGDQPVNAYDTPQSFAEAAAAACPVHRERFRRIRLELTSAGADSGSKDETDRELYLRTRNQRKAGQEFLKKIFDAGRYEILSSSGNLPPNLQGVWNASYNVPWCSDYTQDGNVQTAILALLPSGDFESMESYFTYQEAMLEDYRENSRSLYGCRGIHIPARTSDSGYDIHFDETWPLLFWTAGAGWAARFYYDYWLYTGDDRFFSERALPFMKEAALFYEDFLTEDESGKWVFSPSYSPENTPSGQDSSTTVNATMDISVARELLFNLISGCRTLGLSEEIENVKNWERMLEKMPPYLINEDGALKEWAADDLKDCYDHRHASHLYLLFYDIPEDVRRDETLFQACRKAYEIKMERKKKEKGTMAFGLIQAGMVAAHLGDGAMVETMLQSTACNNYYSTFASAHDFGPRIFNADISGGVPALMLEAIAQSFAVLDEAKRIDYFEIRLLPALPDSMRSGRVEGMRLRGALTLTMEWEDGRVVNYELQNPSDRKLKVIMPG